MRRRREHGRGWAASLLLLLTPFRVLVEEAERAILREALAFHGGQMARKARALGLRGKGDEAEPEDE